MHTLRTSSHSSAHSLATHVTYQIAGFDRLNFVSDIANTVPQDGDYTIRALSFEGDGIQASGLLTVQMQEKHRQNASLVQRLRSVRGMVSVREVQ